MPRKSLRRRALETMQAKVRKLWMMYHLRESLDEEDSLEDDRLLHQSDLLNKMMNSRYLFRASSNRKKRIKFNLEDALSYESVNYNDEEFLNAFRMSRDSLFLLLETMQECEAFKSNSKSSHQRPISYQLLVFLFRIGKEGNGAGALEISGYFGIGKGSVKNYVKICVAALLEIKDEVVYWPDATERKAMRNRLSAYGFRHCVGIIDGTLIILDFRPESYHECYYSRKSFYALNVLIVCDDRKRVIYYNAGWPGSTHDNRVLRNCHLFSNRGEYFSQNEYLLGDSAYSSSPIMVQAFKKQAGMGHLQQNNEFFNTCLAQVRISSEHCIGILKGRFKCMKRVNIKLKNEKKQVEELVDLISACLVLHNLLIDYDEDDIPSSLYDTVDEDIDWGMYDEEEEDIPEVTFQDTTDRRQYVFNSLVNNFLI